MIVFNALGSGCWGRGALKGGSVPLAGGNGGGTEMPELWDFKEGNLHCKSLVKVLGVLYTPEVNTVGMSPTPASSSFSSITEAGFE